MTTDKTGGPAFPKFWTQEDEYSGVTHQLSSGGMDLRDYFAGQALPALLAPVFEALTDLGIQDAAKLEVAGRLVAAAAYAVADTMLKARTNP